MPQSTISHLFKRNNAPTYPTIEALCRTFGISLAQFFADEGEPTVLSFEQKEVLSLWGSLSDEQKQSIKSIMQQLNGL